MEESEKQSMSRSRKLAIVIGVVVGIIAIAAIAVLMFINAGKQSLRDGAAGTTANGEYKVVTYQGKEYRQKPNMASILVVGSDMQNGTDHEGFKGQADAIVVVAVDTESGEIACLSIPRNTMVDIDVKLQGQYQGTDRWQICLAYSVGESDEESREFMSRAVSRLLYNTPMNNVFALDLPCIDDLTDAVGGVEVEALEDIPYTDIKKGDTVLLQGREGRVLHMEGDDYAWDSGTATWYVRYRNIDDSDSPLQRQARGMQFIRAFVDKALDKAKGDPSVIVDLYNIALENSVTDLEASEFAYLASLLVDGGLSKVNFVSLQGELVYNDESEWAQFIPDKDALYRTVLDIYYEEVE